MILNMQDFVVTLQEEHGKEKLDSEGNPITMNCRPPSVLIGRVFLTKPDPRENRHRARIIKIVKEHEDEVKINKNPISTNFRIQMENGPGTDAIENIMAYNDILNHVKKEENNNYGVKWKFREILCHQHAPVGHQDRINID